MGVAVISATDLFRDRDFHPARRCPALAYESYAGLFASVVDLNAWLQQRRPELIEVIVAELTRRDAITVGKLLDRKKRST